MHGQDSPTPPGQRRAKPAPRTFGKANRVPPSLLSGWVLPGCVESPAPILEPRSG